MTSQDIYDLGFAILIRELDGIGHFRFNSKTFDVSLDKINKYLHQLDSRRLVRVEHCERLNV